MRALYDARRAVAPVSARSFSTHASGGKGRALPLVTPTTSPSAWLAYVLVDDLKGATEKAKANGATVLRDITEVPNMGAFAIITDPTGANIGIWQPKAK